MFVREARAGFTLVEILLGLGLLALLGTLLLPGVNALLGSMDDDRADTALRQAITAARAQALGGNRTVLLRFESDGNPRLHWTDGTTDGGLSLAPGIKIAFLPADAGDLMLLGGVLSERSELPGMRFYSDGTCDRVRIRLTGSEPSQIISLDPWTCAPVLAVGS